MNTRLEPGLSVASYNSQLDARVNDIASAWLGTLLSLRAVGLLWIGKSVLINSRAVAEFQYWALRFNRIRSIRVILVSLIVFWMLSLSCASDVNIIAVAHRSNPRIFLVRSRRVLEISCVVDFIITWSFFRGEVLTTWMIVRLCD